MKLSIVSSALLALALPGTLARPTESASVAAPGASSQDDSIANMFDLNALVERGADLLHDFLTEKQDKPKPKRSIAVREVVINLRDQLNSGEVDLNKALNDSLSKFSNATTEVDFNDLKDQGFQLLREGIEARDLNKLAQKVFYAGTSKITRRDTWSWAGFLNGPILRMAAKAGVGVASNLIGRVDLNALARNGLSQVQNMIGNVDMNQVAGQGASALGSMLGGIDVNSVAKTAMGFLFP